MYRMELDLCFVYPDYTFLSSLTCFFYLVFPFLNVKAFVLSHDFDQRLGTLTFSTSSSDRLLLFIIHKTFQSTNAFISLFSSLFLLHRYQNSALTLAS